MRGIYCFLGTCLVGIAGCVNLTDVTAGPGIDVEKKGDNSVEVSLADGGTLEKQLSADDAIIKMLVAQQMNDLTGMGKAGYLPMFGSKGTTLESSAVFQDKNGNVGIGSTSPEQTLDVAGPVRSASLYVGTPSFADRVRPSPKDDTDNIMVREPVRKNMGSYFGILVDMEDATAHTDEMLPFAYVDRQGKGWSARGADLFHVDKGGGGFSMGMSASGRRPPRRH